MGIQVKWATSRLEQMYTNTTMMPSLDYLLISDFVSFTTG